MALQHAFDQEVVMKTGNWFGKTSRWLKFKNVYTQLGYEVRVTGGNFLTHEINASKEDFETILELSKY